MLFFQGSGKCSTCIQPMINNTWPNDTLELSCFTFLFVFNNADIFVFHTQKCYDCYRKILILGVGGVLGICLLDFFLFIYFNDILTLNIQQILIYSKVLFVVPNTKTIKNIVILDTLYPVTMIDVHHRSKFKSFCYESSATWNKLNRGENLICIIKWFKNKST